MEKSIKKLEFDAIRIMLADKASSPMGKERARTLVPSTDEFEVRTLQEQTAEALTLLIEWGNVPPVNFHDVKDSVKLATIGSVLSTKSLMHIGDNLRSTRNMKNFLHEKCAELPYFRGLSESLTANQSLEKRIDEAIIGENMISDKASHTLYTIRRKIEKKKADVRDKLNSLVTSPAYTKYLQDAIVTIRNDRFVLPVKAEHKNNINGIVHDQSAKGGTFYIEPVAVVNLNNELTQLSLDEQAEIQRILQELSEEVGACGGAILSSMDIMVEIDFTIAKGKLALAQNASMPNISSDMYVKIRSGRHPLIPKESVVPLDIWIGRTFNTLLVTGPNTGGKTVSLKTVGLFALMTQAGLHIPAAHGTFMPVFENVLADIGDEQSIAQSLSTFSAHMTNIVWILEQANEHSLVLLDELGAGTDPTEGAALAISILEKLRSRGLLTVATTHYAELKLYALEKEGVENASVEFDVATLSPTYRLLVGIPGKSNAFEISKKLGLSQEIIDDATSRIMTESADFERIIAKVQENQKIAETERDEAIRLRLEAAALKKKVQERENRLAEEKQAVVGKAKKEARDILKKAKTEADEIVKRMKESGLNLSGAEKERQKLREQLNELGDTNFDFSAKVKKRDDSEKAVFEEGTVVKFLPLKQKAKIIKAPNEKGECEIMMGSLKMKANESQLEFISAPQQNTTGSKGRGGYSGGSQGSAFNKYSAVQKSATVKSEIDIRGMNILDAENKLAKYIDDLLASSLGSARIIHGKGTGALRKGIHSYLRKHPNIASFEEAAHNEGGAGATNIKLK